MCCKGAEYQLWFCVHLWQSPEKRGTQSVTVHGTAHGNVNMYIYSFRFSVRDDDGFLAYGRCGVVFEFQTVGVDSANGGAMNWRMDELNVISTREHKVQPSMTL